MTFVPGPPKTDGSPDPYGFGDPAGWQIDCDSCGVRMSYGGLVYDPVNGCDLDPPVDRGPRRWVVDGTGGRHLCTTCAAPAARAGQLGLGI